MNIYFPNDDGTINGPRGFEAQLFGSHGQPSHEFRAGDAVYVSTQIEMDDGGSSSLIAYKSVDPRAFQGTTVRWASIIHNQSLILQSIDKALGFYHGVEVPTQQGPRILMGPPVRFQLVPHLDPTST